MPNRKPNYYAGLTLFLLGWPFVALICWLAYIICLYVPAHVLVWAALVCASLFAGMVMLIGRPR